MSEQVFNSLFMSMILVLRSEQTLSSFCLLSFESRLSKRTSALRDPMVSLRLATSFMIDLGLQDSLPGVFWENGNDDGMVDALRYKSPTSVVLRFRNWYNEKQSFAYFSATDDLVEFRLSLSSPNGAFSQSLASVDSS